MSRPFSLRETRGARPLTRQANVQFTWSIKGAPFSRHDPVRTRPALESA
jgi:hypothetical protein